MLIKHYFCSQCPSVRPSVRFLQSTTPLTVTTQLIDVKLYNVLEIHCSCPQWFLDFSLKAGWRRILQPATPKSGADPGGGEHGALPHKIGKDYDFFCEKWWFFTRNTPKIFATPSARRNFLKCAPPNLKSCTRSCQGFEQ